MKLLIYRPDGTVTRIHLEALPIWRLGLALVSPCDLAIALSYPGHAGMSNVALLSVPFPPEAPDLIKRIASVALTTGELRGDQDRVAEALKELVNLNIRPATIPGIIEASRELVANYWKIREALSSQTPGEFSQPSGGKLVLIS